MRFRARARALDLIDAIEARGGLKGYELLPATDLLRRLGRLEAAREGQGLVSKPDSSVRA